MGRFTSNCARHPDLKPSSAGDASQLLQDCGPAEVADLLSPIVD